MRSRHHQVHLEESEQSYWGFMVRAMTKNQGKIEQHSVRQAMKILTLCYLRGYSMKKWTCHLVDSLSWNDIGYIMTQTLKNEYEYSGSEYRNLKKIIIVYKNKI